MRLKQTRLGSTEHLTPSCDTFCITTPEAQWNLQMSVPTLKQETVECIDEEESACSDNMHSSEILKSSAYLNYYDSKDYVVEQLKMEFPDGELSQSDSSINTKIVSENKELLKLIDTPELTHESTEVGPSFKIKEEDEDIEYQIAIKTHRLEQPGTQENAEDTSTSYALVTPQGEDILLLQKSLKQETRESVKCEYCKKKYKLNYYMKPCRTGEEDEGMKYKCDSCGHIYVSKQTLKTHINKIDNDYRKIYNCWCGEQFRTRIDLDVHENVQHIAKIKYKKYENYKCKSCEAVFNTKSYLNRHMKRVHHDYGRTFKCWCGKEFRTPLHFLEDHKNLQHDPMVKVPNKPKFQCDACKKFFTSKYGLVGHIKRFHHDYGEVYECWCGKQYRSPIQLDIHKSSKHMYVHEGFKFIFSFGKERKN